MNSEQIICQKASTVVCKWCSGNTIQAFILLWLKLQEEECDTLPWLQNLHLIEAFGHSQRESGYNCQHEYELLCRTIRFTHSLTDTSWGHLDITCLCKGEWNKQINMEGGQSGMYLRLTRASSGPRVSIAKTYRDEN